MDLMKQNKKVVHICKQINVTPEFKSEIKSLMKQMFSNESSSIICSLNESFVNDFFYQFLNQGIVSINQRYTKI